MAILSTGNTFGATDTVTSTKLNNIADAATFDDPVDDSTLELHTDGKLRIKDDGVTPAKLSTGGPSWTSQGVLLVGTADINPYDNTGDNPGIALHGSDSSQHGLITSARYQNTAAAFNRTGNDGALIAMRREGVGVGSISVTTSATSYNTSSDYRLKEDIVEMEGSIDRLKALKPCNFAWKNSGERVDGFLAHEAQEVVPEAVTGVKDAVDDNGNPEYQGIDQSKLVPLLTKSLQEAVARIESLEAKVAALEAK